MIAFDALEKLSTWPIWNSLKFEFGDLQVLVFLGRCLKAVDLGLRVNVSGMLISLFPSLRTILIGPFVGQIESDTSILSFIAYLSSKISPKMMNVGMVSNISDYTGYSKTNP